MVYGYFWKDPTFVRSASRERQAEKWIDKAYLKLKTYIVSKPYLMCG